MTSPAEVDEVYRQYPDLVEQLVVLCRPLVFLPLPEMAAANERMQTLAPFFAAPLAYHDGANNLSDQRRVIDAAAALQRVLLDLAAERTTT